MIQSDKHKKTWINRKRELWRKRFNSCEDVRGGFIEAVTLGWTWKMSVFPNGDDPRKQREGVGE